MIEKSPQAVQLWATNLSQLKELEAEGSEGLVAGLGGRGETTRFIIASCFSNVYIYIIYIYLHLLNNCIYIHKI